MRRIQWFFIMSAVPCITLRAQVVPHTGIAVAANRTARFILLVNADLPPSTKSLEGGAVVGALTVIGAVGTLVPDQYNVFVSKRADGWRAVLERDGKIAISSRTVAVATEITERAIPKPRLQATGESDEGIDLGDAMLSQQKGEGAGAGDGSLHSFAHRPSASPPALDAIHSGKATIAGGGHRGQPSIL